MDAMQVRILHAPPVNWKQKGNHHGQETEREMNPRALLLNASYEPHAIIPARRMVRLLMDEKIEVVEHSGDYFRSVDLAIPVPSVARLKTYIVMPERHRSVLLTTKAVLARDNYTCGYCGLIRLSTGQGGNGTLDHIIPRASGGKHVWENAVACCKRCNRRKSHKSLEELGWTLRIQPTRPRGVNAYLLTQNPDPLWLPYMQVAA
jgi:5-methylcytosine-specific restriction endonuclease McrA